MGTPVMEIVFRKLTNDDRTAPSGELLLHGGPVAGEDRREISGLIVEQGLAVFPHGPGEITTIVLQADPTLDDMLACALAERLVGGQTLPESAAAFARYAALLREGLRPSGIPLQDSLEGMFLAIRTAAGEDLTQPEVTRLFLSGWSRMAGVMMRAIDDGVDPFTTSLFENDPEFARERAFLVKDHEVYRQDVARGRQWLMKLPGGPPQASGLILKQPKSLLWKYWSRQDHEAPTGEAFLFLGVCGSARNWVFSTDPIQRLSLKSLADELQSAEVKINPQAAGEDPWFDGKPFAHTLIAAPKQGTALDEKQVLRIVTGWSHARPPRQRSGPRLPAVAAMAASLLVAGALFLFFKGSQKPAADGKSNVASSDVPPVPTAVSRGADAGRAVSATRATGKGKLCLLNIGISKYRAYRSLVTPHRDAVDLRKSFLAHKGTLFETGGYQEILTDSQATKDAILKALDKLRSQMNYFDVAVVTISGHGKRSDYGEYFFLPYDYDKNRDIRTAGISWHDIMTDLGRMPGVVLVILDTCYSGAATSSGRGLDLSENTEDRLKKLVGNMKRQQGLMVISSALGFQQATDGQNWGHGALAVAVLELLNGRPMVPAKGNAAKAAAEIKKYSRNGVVTLGGLQEYVARRVTTLTGGKQAANPVPNKNFDFNSVFLADRRKPSKTKQKRP